MCLPIQELYRRLCVAIEYTWKLMGRWGHHIIFYDETPQGPSAKVHSVAQRLFSDDEVDFSQSERVGSSRRGSETESKRKWEFESTEYVLHFSEVRSLLKNYPDGSYLKYRNADSKKIEVALVQSYGIVNYTIDFNESLGKFAVQEFGKTKLYDSIELFIQSDKTRLQFPINLPNFFHAGVTQELARDILEGNPIGSYLLHQGPEEGTLILSIRGSSGIESMVVTPTKEGGYIIDGKSYDEIQVFIAGDHSFVSPLTVVPGRIETLWDYINKFPTKYLSPWLFLKSFHATIRLPQQAQAKLKDRPNGSYLCYASPTMACPKMMKIAVKIADKVVEYCCDYVSAEKIRIYPPFEDGMRLEAYEKAAVTTPSMGAYLKEQSDIFRIPIEP